MFFAEATFNFENEKRRNARLIHEKWKRKIGICKKPVNLIFRYVNCARQGHSYLNVCYT